MRNSPFWFFLIVVMFLLDLYVFQVLKVVTHSASPRTRSIVSIFYWTLSGFSLAVMILIPFLNFENWPRGLRNILFSTIMALFFGKLITAVFLLVDDLRRLIQWGAGKIYFRDTEGEDYQKGQHISRSLFLSWLGIAAGTGLALSLFYGFTNKYKYKVRRVSMKFPNLPASFRGLKIAQLSDIHSGSFNNREAVLKGVERVMALKPDLILFTGDLVNDQAIEMKEYMDVFNRFGAPLGVYSVLGNHDYGDYYFGYHPEGARAVEKAQNLDRLKQIHGELGWRLLLDENVSLQRNGEQIALIGVQNISGKRNFQTYGNMAKAYKGSESAPFKILMSHDPSHWDAEVRPKYRDIDLTLSGHTHGMQFGVELPWLKWSPVQYVYRQWAGLYSEEAQRLYVNRGFGFIGYPGRVGILPEITLIELT
jgi:hypothetical protein